MGVSKSSVNRWLKGDNVYGDSLSRKRQLVNRSTSIFELPPVESIGWAKKLGLSPDFLTMATDYFSTEFSTEIGIMLPGLKGTSTDNFQPKHYLKYLMDTPMLKSSKLRELVDISERMLNHIQNGKSVTKESIFALLISQGLELDQIHKALSKAGWAFSSSLPHEVVVQYLLAHETKGMSGGKRLVRINDTLETLQLPLLRTGK